MDEPQETLWTLLSVEAWQASLESPIQGRLSGLPRLGRYFQSQIGGAPAPLGQTRWVQLMSAPRSNVEEPRCQAKAVFQKDCFQNKKVFVRGHLRLAIRQKLGDSLELPFPKLSPMEAPTAPLEGRSWEIIGMRRAGKTPFLYQCLAARLTVGVPRHRLVDFNFEDVRMGEVEAADLGMILDDYYRSHPES